MLEMKPDSPLEKVPAAGPRTPGRMRRFVRSLLKWLIVLGLVAGVAAGAYYGWPVVRERFFEPIQTNTAEVGALQDRLVEMAAEVASLKADVSALTGEIAGVSDSQDGLGDRLGSVEDLIASHTDKLAELAGIRASLEAAASADRAEVVRQVSMLRAMELLSRARLFLFEANYGLARVDIEAARSILSAVPGTETDAGALEETLFRIDRTLDNLPGSPVIAADDLDIAWAVLLGAIPPLDTPGTEGTVPTTAP